MVVLMTAGCGAGRDAYKRGTKAEVAKNYEAALEQYRQALALDPGNIEYKLKYEQTRFTAAFDHFQKGRRALDVGELEMARAEFKRAAEIDPSHDFAQQELADVEKAIKSRSQNQPEPILDFEKLAAANSTNANLGAQMKTNLTERLSFRYSASNRTIFENLAAQAGLQVIFGRNYPTRNSTIELMDVNIFEALDLVSLQTGSFWQPVNENTIIVFEDTQQNRRDFEDHIYKTIYLQNVTSTNDLNQIMNVLRTAFSLRGIYQYEPGNAIVIHDTPARVALVENLIRALDKAKAEVVVEATVMEVDHNVLQDLGILPPTDTTLALVPPAGATGAAAASKAVPIRDLNNLNSGSFSVTINDTVAKAIATRGSARLLQNPRIRTTDNVTASLRVGQEVPVPTTSFQSTNIGGGATTAYTLQQVGVQLDIVSHVLLTREISLQVTVTVRAQGGDRQVGDLLIPVFSNRIVAHTIRLAEGETNILGGIISETETVSITGIPGLKDVPLLKYIFGQEHKTRDNAEVIIMLTPHIVRMPNITEEDLKGIVVGSESNLRLRPNYGSASALPLPAQPGQGQPGQGQPAQPAQPARGNPSAAIPPVPAAAPTPTSATVAFGAPVTLAARGETAVSVSINGPNIQGTDLTLSYDPSAFSIKDVHDGGFLSKDGQVIALIHNIDNKKGTATVSLERSPSAPVMSGNGTLLTLTLEPGTKKGPSPLRVTSFGVRDGRAAVHPGGSAEVQVTVP
jgi:general secretion pathway protein D